MGCASVSLATDCIWKGLHVAFLCVSVFCSTMAQGGEWGVLHVAVTQLRLGAV